MKASIPLYLVQPVSSRAGPDAGLRHDVEFSQDLDRLQQPPHQRTKDILLH